MFTVSAYIVAAYWFTSSTSFANPAVTVGRIFSDTFAGIAPASAPGFVLAQVIGAALGLGLTLALYPDATRSASDVVVPHREAAVADVPEVLFVCIHNAGRSQMAAGLLAHHARGAVRVTSAGSAPAEQI